MVVYYAPRPRYIGIMPLTIRITIGPAITIATTIGAVTSAGRPAGRSCSDVQIGGCNSFIGDARAGHSTGVAG